MALGKIFAASRHNLHRARFELQELVQIHHVIPRCCGDHAALRALGFDVIARHGRVTIPTRRCAS